MKNIRNCTTYPKNRWGKKRAHSTANTGRGRGATSPFRAACRTLICCGLAACLLFTAGCGGNQNAQNETTDLELVDPQYVGSGDTTLAASGGEITLPIPQNPETWDPLCALTEDLVNAYNLIFESPLRLDETGRPTANVIETWSVDETGTVYTFNVREGIQFHGGNGTLTARDIKYTIDRILSLEPGTSIYQKYGDLIQSAVVKSDTVLEITLTEKDNRILYFMDFPILCQSYYSSGDIESKKPIGSGPYVMEDFSQSDVCVLKVNQQWWKTLPYIETIYLRPTESDEIERADVESGDLSIGTSFNLTSNRYRGSEQHYTLDYATPFYDGLIPNFGRSTMSDLNLRKAISYGIDRRDIITKVMMNHALPVSSPLMPDFWLGTSTVDSTSEYNRTRALEYLELAGYTYDEQTQKTTKDGRELTIELLVVNNTTQYTYQQEVAKLIQSQLADIGITVEIVSKVNDEFYADLEAGNFDLALMRFYTNRAQDLGYLFGSQSTMNYGNYSSEEFNALSTALTDAISERDMANAYVQYSNFLNDNLPHIGLYFLTESMIYDVQIKGIDTAKYTNAYLDISSWYINEQTAGASVTLDPRT